MSQGKIRWRLAEPEGSVPDIVELRPVDNRDEAMALVKEECMTDGLEWLDDVLFV